MTASDRVLLSALADHSVAPRILDIHLDDCEDDACTGCEPQHLAEKTAAEAGTAKAMFEAADDFDAVGDMHGRAVASKLRELAVLAHALEASRLRNGIRAENAHLLYDADADAVTRPFPYLGKGISARLIDGGQL